MNDTGIDLVGEIPWEAHACRFYETREELLTGVALYLKDGLKANEFCVWALSPSLSEPEAWTALKNNIPELHTYLASRSIEVVEAPDWYALGGSFHRHLVLMRWRRKAAEALAGGYTGMRISRSTILRSRAGKLLGLSSTHFQLQQCPSERELRLIDLNTRLGAHISERRKTQAVLERSEAYLAEAQRLSHTGSWAYNPVTGEMFWSLEHFRIFGLAPGGVRPCFELFLKTIHSEDRPRIKQLFDAPTDVARDYETEYRIIRPDGTVRHLHVVGHPVLIANEISEWIGTVIDITERKLAEKALREAQTELAHATRLATLGELGTSVAHEINQPLGAIVNNSNVCLRLFDKNGSNDEIREALSDIVGDALRASSVVARIRDHVRRTPPKRTLLALSETFNDLSALANHDLLEQHITIRTELEPDLPLVFADRIQIQQVLLNLIMNGIDAMRDVEYDRRMIKLRAAREDRPDDPVVLIQVQDFGRGFRASDAERLFDAFYSTKSNGMGMGLTISRSIVEAHGGRLWTTPNQEGPGATFYFTLPAEQAAHFVSDCEVIRD